MFKKNRWSFLVFFPVLCFLYLVIRLMDMFAVPFLYGHHYYPFLQQVTKTSALQPLGFYQGMIHDWVWGPLAMIFSGVAFLLFALRYLKNAKGFYLGLGVFLYLFLTKWDILFFPPYGDAVTGPFAEAIWLVHHSFDYMMLAQQPGFVAGGPKVYLFSLYPTFLALQMKLIPQPKMFLLLNHLFTFVFASIVIVYYRKIVAQVVSQKTALLLSLLLLFLPIFQNQAETINMEMPLVLFGILTVYALTIKDIPRAFIFSLLAALVKGVGIILGGVVFMISVLLLFDLELKGKRRKNIGWGLLSLVCVIIFTYLNFFVLYRNAQVEKVGLFQGWPLIAKFQTSKLFLINSICFIGIFIFEGIKGKKWGPNLFLKRHYVAFINLCACLFWYGLFVHSYVIIGRYLLLLTPFLLFLTFYHIQYFIKNEKWISGLIIFILMASLACSYGLQFNLFGKKQAWDHGTSLEYRNGVTLYRRTAHTLEDKYGDYLIGSPLGMVQLLTFPELGYVRNKLNVMVYGFNMQFGNVKNFEGLDKIDIARTIWISFGNERYAHINQYFPFPIGPNDRIEEEIFAGEKKVILFRGGFSIELLRQIKEKELKK